MSMYSVTVISTAASLLSHSTSIGDDPIVNNTFSSEVPVLAESAIATASCTIN